MFHVQLLPLLENEVWLQDQGDVHFISASLRLLQWLITQDQSAAEMRLVSYIEIYVLMRDVLGGPVGLLGISGILFLLLRGFRWLFGRHLRHVSCETREGATQSGG